jgi:protein AFG1
MTPTESYNKFVDMGIIRPDHRQLIALQLVERVYHDLVAYKKSPAAKVPREVELVPPNRLGMVPDFVVRKQAVTQVKRALDPTNMKVDFHPLSKVKGLYLHGGVGCGKTMLMDILFHEAPMSNKVRIHFHQFMLDVQKTMHEIRQMGRSKLAQVDVFDEVAQRMATNAELLCFDEIAVSDVSDAMILKRLFMSFYKIGVCAVFTSNRPPQDLYKGGLNREGFLPFIRLIESQCQVHDMASSTDYRLSGTEGKTYFFPFCPEKERGFRQVWLDLTKGLAPSSRTLRVFGRDVVAPRCVGGCVIFDFHELCSAALSAADYEVLAKTFHTFFIENVPQLPADDSDTKRRFLHLIDILYQYRSKVVMYAEVAPLQLEALPPSSQISISSGGKESPLQIGGEGGGGKELSTEQLTYGQSLVGQDEGSFQMQRCISRINEMSSQEYLESEHKHEEVSLETQIF